MSSFVHKHLAKIIFILAIVSVTSAFFINYLYRQEVQRGRAAIEQLQLNFNPPTIAVGQNQQFLSDITLTPFISFSSLGYDFTVVFDPTKVQVRHIGYMLGAVATGGDSDATLESVNRTGRIHLLATTSTQSEAPSPIGYPIEAGKEYKVVDLDLTATSTAGSVINLDYTPNHYFRRSLGDAEDTVNLIAGQMVINGGPATPTPTCSPEDNCNPPVRTPTPTCAPNAENCSSSTPTPTCATTASGGCAPTTPTPTCTQLGGPAGCATPTPQKGNTILNLKVRFQGITSQPLNKNPMFMIIKVKGGLLTATVTKRVEFTVNTDGTWSGKMAFDLPVNPFDYIPKYSLYLKGPKHIQKRICDLTPPSTGAANSNCTKDNIQLDIGQYTLDFSNVILLAGDLPITNGEQNGVIDSEDTSYIRQNFGKTDPAVLEKADLNLDNHIDTQDYSLVIAALSIKYDDPVEGE